MSNQSIKEKIITAAITCIEQYGIDGTTTRSIAREAGVNSAAINYYFSSKEILMDEVYKKSLDNAYKDLDDYITADADKETIYPSLIKFFTDWIEGVIRYPNISKAHLFSALHKDEKYSLFEQSFSSFLTEINPFIEQLTDKKDAKEIRVMMTQIISAVIFPALMSRFFSDYMQIDLSDPAEQKKYVTSLFERFLVPPK